MADDELVAPPAVGEQADQVGHGAAGHKDGRLLTHPFSGHLLQSVDRRVFAKDVVAHLGLVYGFSHGRRGQSHSVAA